MIRLRTIVSLSLAIAAVAAHADITSLTDNFDSDTVALNKTDFTNWTVTDGTVDLIGDSFNSLGLGAGNYVDLDGSSNDAGVFTTTESFAPGAYTLKFDLAGNQRGGSDDVVVNLGSYSQTLHRDATDPFSTVSVPVVLLTSGKLSFENLGGDNVGAILDNVSVQPVPEPASLAALALGGAAFLRRRRAR